MKIRYDMRFDMATDMLLDTIINAQGFIFNLPHLFQSHVSWGGY